MKTLFTFAFLFISFISFSQSATYDQVASKEVKGKVEIYTSKSGEVFTVGDTITIGQPASDNQFDAIIFKTGGFIPAKVGGSQVVIKKMTTHARALTVFTTKAQTVPFGLYIQNLDEAIESGEVESNTLSSDDALAELKKWKSKLELELITQAEYEEKKLELVTYIK